jgi:hypothetical protein
VLSIGGGLTADALADDLGAPEAAWVVRDGHRSSVQ